MIFGLYFIDVFWYNMSCSEVMYQAYYPYLYQRPGGAPPVSAHPVPRTGPFTSPFATAAHQYDRVSNKFCLKNVIKKVSQFVKIKNK